MTSVTFDKFSTWAAGDYNLPKCSLFGGLLTWWKNRNACKPQQPKVSTLVLYCSAGLAQCLIKIHCGDQPGRGLDKQPGGGSISHAR